MYMYLSGHIKAKRADENDFYFRYYKGAINNGAEDEAPIQVYVSLI